MTGGRLRLRLARPLHLRLLKIDSRWSLPLMAGGTDRLTSAEIPMSRSLPLRVLVSLLALIAFGGVAATASASSAPGTLICHHAGPNHLHEMRVDGAALDGHIGHGDNFGKCPTTGGGGGGGGGGTPS